MRRFGYTYDALEANWPLLKACSSRREKLAPKPAACGGQICVCALMLCSCVTYSTRMRCLCATRACVVCGCRVSSHYQPPPTTLMHVSATWHFAFGA